MVFVREDSIRQGRSRMRTIFIDLDMKQFELLSGSCTYSKSSSTLCLLTELGSQRLISVGEEHIRGSLFRKERKVRSSLCPLISLSHT